MASSSFYFDEIVYMGIVGGGFLRTPFIHATKTIMDGFNNQEDCAPLTAEVIHIPASLRRSTLTEPDPPFRRVVFTSDLMRRIATDKAVQFNQEAAGIVFKFHEDANNCIAHAFCLPETKLFDEPAFILDNVYPGFQLPTALAVNDLGLPVNLQLSRAPSGFLLFLSRFWQDQRHVDADIMMTHRIPLQLDLDFNMFWAGQVTSSPPETIIQVPIWGNCGTVTVWDARLGIQSAAPASPIANNGGTMEVLGDAQTGLYLQITSVVAPLESIPIVLQDASGQTFTREVVCSDTFPSPQYISLPAARINTPYTYTLPPDMPGIRITDMRLPVGITYNPATHIISGTPTEYGGQFYVKAEWADPITQYDPVYFLLPVNRTPRLIYSFPQCTMNNDHSTGEYYAMQFMPYGLELQYGGWSYECRRARTGPNAVPFIRHVPFVYGHANRRGAVDAESSWRNASAVTLASQGT